MLTKGEQHAIRHAMKMGEPFEEITIRDGNITMRISSSRAPRSWSPATVVARLEIDDPPWSYSTQSFGVANDLFDALRKGYKRRKEMRERREENGRSDGL